MAILTKNIDTRQYGSLKAGRLLNGILPASKIAELIVSGHAELTEDDESLGKVSKTSENATGERESLFERAFSMGYAYAMNDAVDSEIISKAEAETCGLVLPFDDDETGAEGPGGTLSEVVSESVAPVPESSAVAQPPAADNSKATKNQKNKKTSAKK